MARIAFMVSVIAVVLTGVKGSGGPLEATEKTTPPPAIKGSFFALSVGDVDKMAAWYSMCLGYRVDRTGGSNGSRFAILSRESGLIEMVEFPTAKSRQGWGLGKVEAHEVRGIFKVGVEVQDLEASLERAKAQGATVFFPIVQARDVSLRTFGLTDPEGNIVQFFGK